MNALTAWRPQVLSVLRIMSALLFLQHGTVKLLGFPTPYPNPLSMVSLTAGILELVGGVLLAIGLFTRPVAFILSGQMAVAYFLAHAPQSFYPIVNKGELAIMFCFVFLYIVFAGPGPWSVDAKRSKSSLV
ncbi:DoxX family protein [Methylopila sp. Yamaguchi]|uniref:DoxX family protein n=1 Tax=Methylopila sp. Yamaguchi TaxID=1437817 RepID=UPI000CB5FB5A|nr:DoxX family protein [Methylopila sp. Yamaguchi]GBD48160.1 DoxX family protein [Methylopila sp. Yamaguchi]